MTLNVKNILLAVAALAVVAAAYVQKLRADRDAALVAAHNAEAARDSAKVVWRGDSARAWQRLALLEDSNSALRKKLKAGRSAATTVVVVRPDTVFVEHPADTSSLADSVKGPPADVSVRLSLSSPPTWSWSIRPSPIPLTVDVGCRGRLDPDVLVTAPDWVRLDSVATRVRTDVCGSVVRRPSVVKTALTWVGLVLIGTQLGKRLGVP